MATEPTAPSRRDSDIDALAQHLRLVSDRFARLVRAPGYADGLSRPQESALALLEAHGSMTTAELSRREHLRPQSMGTIVAGLVDANLVVKSRDATDGRRELLEISPSGRSALLTTQHRRDDVLRRMLESQLDDLERAVLLEALRVLDSLQE